jgi:hypothetical protein
MHELAAWRESRRTDQRTPGLVVARRGSLGSRTGSVGEPRIDLVNGADLRSGTVLRVVAAGADDELDQVRVADHHEPLASNAIAGPTPYFIVAGARSRSPVERRRGVACRELLSGGARMMKGRRTTLLKEQRPSRLAPLTWEPTGHPLAGGTSAPPIARGNRASRGAVCNLPASAHVAAPRDHRQPAHHGLTELRPAISSRADCSRDAAPPTMMM